MRLNSSPRPFGHAIFPTKYAPKGCIMQGQSPIHMHAVMYPPKLPLVNVLGVTASPMLRYFARTPTGRKNQSIAMYQATRSCSRTLIDNCTSDPPTREAEHHSPWTLHVISFSAANSCSAFDSLMILWQYARHTATDTQIGVK